MIRAPREALERSVAPRLYTSSALPTETAPLSYARDHVCGYLVWVREPHV